MALISRRHLRNLKLCLLTPIVEKILLVSYLIAIILFIVYNNDYYGQVDRYDMRQEVNQYFKYPEFMNITVVDKSKLGTNPLEKVDYDLYDYLEFMLENRLFQKKRSSYKVIGTVRVVQARVRLDCNDTFPAD
jgi:hypothetical protein